MGASRKLQGEIDRVLKKVQEGVDMFDSIWNKLYDTENPNQKEKYEGDLKKEIKKLQRYRDQIKTWQQSSEIKDKKISASYEQALMESRKLIEREMERFKICEKETKTKAFSIEGLGQQPKTDPKEKAKSETRDWLNNVVSELENEIDSFEAEMEGLSVKKGKMRPPRLTHLETSILRHKAHIMKLELILRLLDNDELSPEQVNDVKDFLDDYVDRNQEDFDEFSDVDELYSSLPLEKESLEDLVTIVPPSLVKGVSASTAAVSMKPSLGGTPAQTHTTVPNPILASAQSVVDESVLQDKDTDIAAKTAPPKGSALIPASQTLLDTHAISGDVSTTPGITPGATEDDTNFAGRRSSLALGETVSRSTSLGGLTVQPSSSTTSPPSSGNTFPSTGSLGCVPFVFEMGKRNTLAPDDQSGNTATGKTPSRLILPQASNASDGHRTDVVTLGSRVLTSPVVPGMQWMSGSSFQNQAEVGQVRGRTEIAPDQREKFIQRFQQVQQQGQTNLGITSIAGGKHYSAQQQSPLLQQFNGQSSSVSAQHAPGTGVQPLGFNTPAASASSLQKPSAMHLLPTQKMASTSSKEAEIGHSKVEEFQQQPLKEDPSSDCGPPPKIAKNVMPDCDLRASYAVDTNEQSRGVSLAETSTGMRETELTPGPPLQSNTSTGSLGVIGQRSVSDIGAGNDQLSYNLKMLEAAYHKLPQPKDSERPKNYTPRNPAITPASYPQVQAPIVNKPAFWERLGADTYGNDMCFFSFYYQQSTYQQYLAAKELKKQSWRYNKKFNTWFQRHEEPRITTDDYEKGKYVYFDFQITSEEQSGWCQRLKNDFTFEYLHLEDELNV